MRCQPSKQHTVCHIHCRGLSLDRSNSDDERGLRHKIGDECRFDFGCFIQEYLGDRCRSSLAKSISIFPWTSRTELFRHVVHPSTAAIRAAKPALVSASNARTSILISN